MNFFQMVGIIRFFFTKVLFVFPKALSLNRQISVQQESLNSVFPKICDTKVIASTKPVKDQVAKSSLDQLFNTIKNKPFRRPAIVFPKGYKKYESMEISHEAGYDSYMTGTGGSIA